MIQRSLVLMKPDAVQRGIVGEILSRFERMGLKMIGAKLIKVDEDFGSKHYTHGEDWYVKVGKRNLKDCEDYNLDPEEVFGTSDPREIGILTDKRNAEFISSGPVLAVVFEGVNAVQRIRDHVGSTFSSISPAGTIRGDYGIDSAFSGMARKRTSYNIVHASGTPEEAKDEIRLWFREDELLEYKRVHEDLYKY